MDDNTRWCWTSSRAAGSLRSRARPGTEMGLTTNQNGGAGLRSWLKTADYSWFCSVAECMALRDTNFEYGRTFLKVEGEQAHGMAMVAVGGPTYVNRVSLEFIPPEEPDVLYTQTTTWSGKLITKVPNCKKNSADFWRKKTLKRSLPK